MMVQEKNVSNLQKIVSKDSSKTVKDLLAFRAPMIVVETHLTMDLENYVSSILTTVLMGFSMMVQELNAFLIQNSVLKISLMTEQERNVLILLVNAQSLNISATAQEQGVFQILNFVLKGGLTMALEQNALMIQGFVFQDISTMVHTRNVFLMLSNAFKVGFLISPKHHVLNPLQLQLKMKIQQDF